jgi:hypothetical protein
MSRLLSCALFFVLVFNPFGVPAAFAGQIKNINSEINGPVSGNDSDEPADDNTVNVNYTGTVKGTVSGGRMIHRAVDARANGNTVKVKGGTVTGWVYGGHANVGVRPAPQYPTHYAHADGNSVVISGDTVNGTVYIGTVNGYVHGGRADTGGSDFATANGNTVKVNSGGKVTGRIYGGYVHVADDGSTGIGSASADGNTVEINGGTVLDNIYGGYVESVSRFGVATAVGNTVEINGGTVSGHVYGGYAAAYSSDTATGNTVTIRGNPTFGPYTVISGGYSSSGNARSGNTLNVHSPITTMDVENFENWNFYLPSSLSAGQAMITIRSREYPYIGIADLGANAKVHVGIEGSGSPLRKGDAVTLIDASQGTLNGNLADSVTSGQGMQGITLLYEFNLRIENNLLLAEVADRGINPQTKALSEGGISVMSLITQGADLVAGQGMNNAVSAAGSVAQGAGGGASPAGFGAVSAGQSRYNTGSHVDMSGFSLMAGLSWGVNTTPGRLTLGAFAEYGRGSYDTYNSFSNAAPVRGRGESHHVGGGILGRMDFSDTGPGRIYIEASGRAGGIHNEYSSSDLIDAQGRKTEYDSSSAYYGFHCGTGYVLNITDDVSLDLHSKYFWTRQAGTSVTLSTGDSVKFRDADSSRLRVGGRVTYAVNGYVSPYVGAAWEHEFDGKAEATSNGFALEAPSLRGNTGIGEIGLTIQPSKNSPLSFDLGVQGYTGKREGVTGSLQVKLEF